MGRTRAVIFDFIGTLTNLRGYNLEASRMTTKMKLYRVIANVGFKVDCKSFREAYIQTQKRCCGICYARQIKERHNPSYG